MIFIGRHTVHLGTVTVLGARDLGQPTLELEDYNISINNQNCVGREGLKMVSMSKNGSIMCFAADHAYSFNPKTNRFLTSTLYGFVDGDDNNDSQPYIAGGTCTKIGE
jgi:hypothetical protein